VARSPVVGGSATALGLAAIAGVLEAGYFHALGRALTLGPLGPVYTDLARRRGAVGVAGCRCCSSANGSPPPGRSAPRSSSPGSPPPGCRPRSRGPRGDRRRACAAFIAGYNLTYKHALNTGSSPLLVFAVSMVVATALGALLGGVRYRTAFVDSVRAQPWSTLGAGAVCATAFVLFMFGLAEGGAAYVFTLRNTSVLWATALGMLLGERPSRASLLGVALVFAGACALGSRSRSRPRSRSRSRSPSA
jgi:uncharacterized membrane protein